MALAVGRELAEDAASCQWANDAATVLVQPPLTIVKTTAINDPSVMRQRSIISEDGLFTESTSINFVDRGRSADAGGGGKRYRNAMLAFLPVLFHSSSHGF